MSGCRHWEVISDLTITTGGFYEPPEVYRPWGMVEADSAREARLLAIKLPEFREHVQEMRGDNKPPMSKIAARRCECHHGVCWACSTETVFCAECAAECEDMEP